MTPALLPGYRAVAHDQTGQPCLVQSDNCTDYVQGMLIFGQGKKSRNRIHKHYRPYGRRTKIDVEIDVMVFAPTDYRESEGEHCRLERRRLKAHAWIKSPGAPDVWVDGSAPSHLSTFCQGKPWTMEDYLQSINDEDDRGLQIDPSVYDVDGDGGVSLPATFDEEVSGPPEREIVMAGWGTIQYDRSEEGFSGW